MFFSSLSVLSLRSFSVQLFQYVSAVARVQLPSLRPRGLSFALSICPVGLVRLGRVEGEAACSRIWPWSFTGLFD